MTILEGLMPRRAAGEKIGGNAFWQIISMVMTRSMRRRLLGIDNVFFTEEFAFIKETGSSTETEEMK